MGRFFLCSFYEHNLTMGTVPRVRSYVPQPLAKVFSFVCDCTYIYSAITNERNAARKIRLFPCFIRKNDTNNRRFCCDTCPRIGGTYCPIPATYFAISGSFRAKRASYLHKSHTCSHELKDDRRFYNLSRWHCILEPSLNYYLMKIFLERPFASRTITSPFFGFS